jgi:hypothetical protein
MQLLNEELTRQLVANHQTGQYREGYDPQPVVKFFNPAGAGTWLIASMDPHTRVMFGLCDLGMGFPELGLVLFDELADYRSPFGLGIERDLYWTPTKTLSEYTAEAMRAQRIVA